MSDMVDLVDPITNGERFVMDGLQLPSTGNLPAVYPSAQGDLAINSFGGVITAQRVAVPRNHNQIIQRLKALCAMAGDGYVYSWSVKDRKNNREQIVEGPTIKLANDLARTYGNNQIDVRVQRDGDWLVIYARFTDLETGYSYTRPFQQRLSQDTGMKDAERRMDMVFQIGVSKAIRNVVVNALSTFADFMVEESKNNLIAKVQENPDKANGFIDKVLDRFEINVGRVEAVIGRKRDKWTVRDLARVYSEMRGLVDGMTVADEIYPTDEAAKEVMTAKQADKADLKPETGKAGASGRSGKKADPAPADAKPAATATAPTAEDPADKPKVDPAVAAPTGEVAGDRAGAMFTITDADGVAREFVSAADARGAIRDLINAAVDEQTVMAIRNANGPFLASSPMVAGDIQSRLNKIIAEKKAAADAEAQAKADEAAAGGDQGGNDNLFGEE